MLKSYIRNIYLEEKISRWTEWTSIFSLTIFPAEHGIFSWKVYFPPIMLK